jgi:hypothetical protein
VAVEIEQADRLAVEDQPPSELSYWTFRTRLEHGFMTCMLTSMCQCRRFMKMEVRGLFLVQPLSGTVIREARRQLRPNHCYDKIRRAIIDRCAIG